MFHLRVRSSPIGSGVLAIAMSNSSMDQLLYMLWYLPANSHDAKTFAIGLEKHLPHGLGAITLRAAHQVGLIERAATAAQAPYLDRWADRPSVRWSGDSQNTCPACRIDGVARSAHFAPHLSHHGHPRSESRGG